MPWVPIHAVRLLQVSVDNMQCPCWYQWGTEIHFKDCSARTSSINSFIISLPALMSLGAKGKYSACTQPDLPS